MVNPMPENAARQFKCPRCGLMFSVRGKEGDCPSCHFHCTELTCRTVDGSDEGY